MSMVTEKGFLDISGITRSLIDKLYPIFNEHIIESSKDIVGKEVGYYHLKHLSEESFKCFFDEGKAFILIDLFLEESDSKKNVKSNCKINVYDLGRSFLLLIPESEKEIALLNNEVRFFWKGKKSDTGLPRFLSDSFSDEEIYSYFESIKMDKDKYEKELKCILISSFIKNLNSDKNLLKNIMTSIINSKKEIF